MIAPCCMIKACPETAENPAFFYYFLKKTERPSRRHMLNLNILFAFNHIDIALLVIKLYNDFRI